MDQKQSVCIIGAGAAGLCALRHFTSRPDRFEPIVCYEQTDLIGGTWNYTESVGTDRNGLPLHTSMYRDLSTNLPMQIMEFPDFKWTKPQSYVPHSVVLKYLHDYSDHFNLHSFIKFEHHLTHLTRVDTCWQVTVNNLVTSQATIEQFDIVLHCPGRYCAPRWPQIESLSHFSGQVIHAHSYRTPEQYSGQRVAVIGAGPSGIDICLEVAAVAEQVVLLNRHDYALKGMPSNVHLVTGEIDQFTADSIRLKHKNGGAIEELQIDSVILATGYRYTLDYLDQQSCALRLNPADDTLDGIYRHLINIQHPTMALLNVLQRTLPFALYHQQILYFMKILLGEVQLPSKEQMAKEVAHDLAKLKQLGIRAKDRHIFNTDLLKDYFELLERDAHLEPIAPVKIKLFRDLWKVRFDNVTGYKTIDYRLLNETEYEEVGVS